MLIKKSKHYTTIKLYYIDDYGCIIQTTFHFLTDSLEFNIHSDISSFAVSSSSYIIKLRNIITGGYLERKLKNFIDQFKLRRGSGCRLYADIFYNKLKYTLYDVVLEVHYNHFYSTKWDICDVILKPNYVKLQF